MHMDKNEMICYIFLMKNLTNIGSISNCHHFPSHSHTIWEMVYYSKGSVECIIGGKGHVLSEGTFVCLPPNVSHEEIGLDKFDNYYFSVGEFKHRSNKPIIVTDTSNYAIGNQVRLMYLAFVRKVPNYQMICECHLNTITQYIVSQAQESPYDISYINLFIDELIINASDCDFKITDLKRSVPFSFDYFRVLFRQSTGLTPLAYLNNIRIANAKQLLKHQYGPQGLTISNIAILSGFHDPLYFSRFFKKHTGLSPMAWVNSVK